VPTVLKSGSLSFLEPSGPVQACNWIALPFLLYIICIYNIQYITIYIIHNITAKAVLKFGSEAWVLKKREEQHLEAAQMKFLRHLLGITKLDKEKNQCGRKKNGSTEYSKGNKTVPGKVATTRTED